MDLFVKSPNWFLPIGGNVGINHDCRRHPQSVLRILLITLCLDSEEERAVLRKDPKKLIEKVREMDAELNGSFDYFLLNTPESNGAIEFVKGRMRELFRDDRIFEGMYHQCCALMSRLTGSIP